MDESLNGILKRRSIRKYQDGKIPDKLIEKLLKAAMSAPSACNQQPWHFVIIDDREKLGRISKAHSGISLLSNSPLMILVCGEPKATTLEYYWEQDCSAATENILIAANMLNLGAVWCGINPRDEKDETALILRDLLKIPDHIRPFSMVSVGYPAETVKPADRYNEDKVHRNSVW